MRVTRVTCDKCGVEIQSGGSVLVVTAGSLRNRFSEPADLCGPCGSALVEWLANGPAEAAPKPSKADTM